MEEREKKQVKLGPNGLLLASRRNRLICFEAAVAAA